MSIYGLVDIDNFTLFNEKFGYEKGNVILGLFEKLLNELLSPHFLQRLDSDEFIFQVKGSFKENDIIFFDLLKTVQSKFGITISIGLIQADDDFDYKQNIKILQSNMLLAKRNGKNKICLK